jgi:hypothetical protein
MTQGLQGVLSQVFRVCPFRYVSLRHPSWGGDMRNFKGLVNFDLSE